MRHLRHMADIHAAKLGPKPKGGIHWEEHEKLTNEEVETRLMGPTFSRELIHEAPWESVTEKGAFRIWRTGDGRLHMISHFYPHSLNPAAQKPRH
jgi:hypothetical protein